LLLHSGGLLSVVLVWILLIGVFWALVVGPVHVRVFVRVGGLVVVCGYFVVFYVLFCCRGVWGVDLVGVWLCLFVVCVRWLQCFCLFMVRLVAVITFLASFVWYLARYLVVLC